MNLKGVILQKRNQRIGNHGLSWIWVNLAPGKARLKKSNPNDRTKEAENVTPILKRKEKTLGGRIF